MELAAGTQDLAELPVDAETDDRMAAARLDVNVAGPLPQGLHDQEVDEVDDRAPLVALVGGLQFDLNGVFRNLHRRGVQVGGYRVDAKSLLVAALDHPPDAGTAGKHGADAEVREPLDFVDVPQVLRFGHGHAEGPPHAEEGQRGKCFRTLLRDQTHHQGVHHPVAELDRRHPQATLENRQELLLGDEAQLHERLSQLQAQVRLLLEGILQLLGRHQPGLQELVAEQLEGAVLGEGRIALPVRGTRYSGSRGAAFGYRVGHPVPWVVAGGSVALRFIARSSPGPKANRGRSRRPRRPP